MNCSAAGAMVMPTQGLQIGIGVVDQPGYVIDEQPTAGGAALDTCKAVPFEDALTSQRPAGRDRPVSDHWPWPTHIGLSVRNDLPLSNIVIAGAIGSNARRLLEAVAITRIAATLPPTLVP